MKEIRLSILVGVSMLLLMPNVASAQNNLEEESINSPSSSIWCEYLPILCRPPM